MTAPNQPSVTASGIKKGQWVRVTVEGKVDEPVPGRLFLDGIRSGLTLNLGCPDIVSVEVLPDPEQEWQRGDVVLDESGQVYLRLGEDSPQWRYLYQGSSSRVPSLEVGEHVPHRPLTLLIRDGKPVTS